MNEIMEPTGSTEVTDYNPAQNAMEIHASEAAERAAKRAKNPEALDKAIRAKLEAQRSFAKEYRVLFTQGKHTSPDSAVGRSPEYCEQFGFNERTVQRWAEKLIDPNSYESECHDQLEKVARMLEMYSSSTGSAHVSNSDNHWYTPSQYIESARRVMGTIDLDPATSNLAQSIVKAKVFHTVKDNGLEQSWAGNVWMNPPYSMPEIELFINKLLSEPVGEWVVLTNNSSDTGWYHALLNSCTSICIPKGRIGFVNKDGKIMATRQGQTFFYRGENIAGFIEEFGIYGRVLHVN